VHQEYQKASGNKKLKDKLQVLLRPKEKEEVREYQVVLQDQIKMQQIQIKNQQPKCLANVRYPKHLLHISLIQVHSKGKSKRHHEMCIG
jgi:hypothetical protein